MRAIRIYAKKKECANAPAGPFTTFSHCVYGYNIRNELISAAKNTEHQYQYDELTLLPSPARPSRTGEGPPHSAGLLGNAVGGRGME